SFVDEYRTARPLGLCEYVQSLLSGRVAGDPQVERELRRSLRLLRPAPRSPKGPLHFHPGQGRVKMCSGWISLATHSRAFLTASSRRTVSHTCNGSIRLLSRCRPRAPMALCAVTKFTLLVTASST